MTGFAHVIFDLDGTLVDTAPLCADILTEMLRKRGSARSVSSTDARNFLTQGGQQIVAALLGDECGDLEAEVADFRSRYASRATPVDCLFPGVAEGLRELAGHGIGMAICSNKPQHLCEKILRDLGLDGIVPVVAGSLPDRPLKPSAEFADRTLAGLGADPAHCLYVGDSEVDRLTAAAAGVPFLFVTYGYAEPDFVRGETASVDRFEDAVRYILGARQDRSKLPRVA